MADPLLCDDARTMAGLESVAGLLAWAGSLPPPVRQRLWSVLAQCGDQQRRAVDQVLGVLKDAASDPAERQRALATLADALALHPHAEATPLDSAAPRHDSQQAAFAERLQALMAARQVSQTELAQRIGCTQAAVSQLLHRRRRPRRQTIFKLAEALGVAPRALWPDLEVAELLDAAADFQQPEHVLSAAEARALDDSSRLGAERCPLNIQRAR